MSEATTTQQRRRRLRLQLILSAVLLVAGLALLNFGGEEDAASRAKRLASETNLHFGYGDPSSFYLPPYEAEDAALPDVDLVATDDASASIALSAIERALRQYPEGFVQKLIEGIFVAGEIRIGGAHAGGTIGPAWIVLAAPSRLGREGIYATSLIGVHHELSSFVYRRRPETAARWAHFAPAGWTERVAPTEMIARASGLDPEPETGFLSAYGSSNAENDFNVYAEKVFTEPVDVAKRARKYPLIREKLEFVMAEYVAIDARMAAVFRSLGLD